MTLQRKHLLDPGTYSTYSPCSCFAQMGFFLYPIFGEMVCRYTVSSFFRACSIPFSKVLSILKVVKDAEKLSFFLRLSGCLIKKRVSFLQKSVWHKDEEEKKVDWKKNRFFINFLFPLQFFERSLKCLLILKVWNLAARSS